MNTGRTQFKKGHIPWHKGKTGVYSKQTLERWSKKRRGSKNPHTPEWNQKIRESNLGKNHGICPEERKQRISMSLMGKPRSEEIKKKISEAQRKEKHWNWKGGITQDRETLDYKKWRDDCLKRDNYIDQKTKLRGGKLEVHHINNFADVVGERFNIENGITFSVETHKKFHKKYGRKNNTKEQLVEFLQN